MRAGELETSILLHSTPELVRPGYEQADWRADQRPYLLSLGMAGYTETGVIGVPSLGTASKGKAALGTSTERFRATLDTLSGAAHRTRHPD
jgi:creatinine amidohydrolase